VVRLRQGYGGLAVSCDQIDGSGLGAGG